MKLKDVQERSKKEATVLVSARIEKSDRLFIQKHKINLRMLIQEAIKQLEEEIKRSG